MSLKNSDEINSELSEDEISVLVKEETIKQTKKRDVKQIFWSISLYLIFLVIGWITVGPVQWGNVPIGNVFKIIFKIGVPVILLVVSIIFYKIEKCKEYWEVTFSFFIGSFAFLVVWLFGFIPMFDTEIIRGFALTKLVDSIIIIIPVIVLVLLVKIDFKSIYLSIGKWKLGLLIGIPGFIIFMLISFPVSKLMFGATDLTLNEVLTWSPWILIFIFSNAIMEEIIYRGLFLKKYEKYFHPLLANLLQTIIFALMHFGVTYTTDQFIFLGVNTLLAFGWGFVAQKTDSLIAPILLHAGADFIVIIGIFSQM